MEAPGKQLAPDRTRKSEYTQFILEGGYDMGEVNKGRADAFMKEHWLPSDILEADQKKND